MLPENICESEVEWRREEGKKGRKRRGAGGRGGGEIVSNHQSTQ